MTSRFVSVDPATGEQLASFAAHGEQHVDAALAEAHHAQRRWGALDVGERSRHLGAVAGVLRSVRDSLARLATLEMGKPIVEAEAEIDKCAWTLEWFSEHGSELVEPELVPTAAELSYVQYRPLGVVLAVMPWNYPFWQFFRAAAAILTGGNTVVLKHAPNVPQCALAIQELFAQAGVPTGVVSTLLVDVDAVDGLIADPRIAALTLTGSDTAGAAVAAKAGSVIKKCVLELGGSDPFIVLADADIERAATVACRARNQNNGQSCIAAKRFIVQDVVADEFTERFVEQVAALRMGDPMDRDTQIGPMAREDLRAKLHRQLRESISRGGEVLIGGRAPTGGGYYFEPTVVAATPELPICQEETFGPLAAILRVGDAEEAVEVANGTQFGLGSALWTDDIDHGRRLANRIEAGMVFINDMTASDARVPFGGVKRSGYGRELSSQGVHEFMNAQTVWIGHH